MSYEDLYSCIKGKMKSIKMLKDLDSGEITPGGGGQAKEMRQLCQRTIYIVIQSITIVLSQTVLSGHIHQNSHRLKNMQLDKMFVHWKVIINYYFQNI